MFYLFVTEKLRHTDKPTTPASFLPSVDLWHKFNKPFYWPTLLENKPWFKKFSFQNPWMKGTKKEWIPWAYHLNLISLLDLLLFLFLDNKSDINPESIKSKYGFIIQSGVNINETPGEQMDLAIVKLAVVSKNILYVPNHFLYAIFQQLTFRKSLNYSLIPLGFRAPCSTVMLMNELLISG